MNKNINKMKGAANVKEIGSEEIFDSRNAEIRRDERNWDDFQLMGESNREEMEYVSQPKNMSEKEMQKVLDRGFAFRMGRKIQMMLDAEAA